MINDKKVLLALTVFSVIFAILGLHDINAVDTTAVSGIPIPKLHLIEYLQISNP